MVPAAWRIVSDAPIGRETSGGAGRSSVRAIGGGSSPCEEPTLGVMVGLSPRLRAVVQALQLREGMRVVEIGCGPGAAARAVADLVGATGHVLAVDRSAKAIEQVVLTAGGLIAEGRLSVRQVAVEDLALQSGEAPYDLAFAVRVGALDGRFPEAGGEALRRLARVLVPGGRLFIDGGDPPRELDLPA